MTMSSVGGATVARAGDTTVVVKGDGQEATIVVATPRGVTTLSTESGQGTAVRRGRLQTLAADASATERARRLAQQIQERPSGSESADLARQAADLVRGRAGRVDARDVGRVEGNFFLSARDVSLGFQITDESVLGKVFKPLLGNWTSAFAPAKPLSDVDITFNRESGSTTVALSGLGRRGRPARVDLLDSRRDNEPLPELRIENGQATAYDRLFVFNKSSDRPIVTAKGLNFDAAEITPESLAKHQEIRTLKNIWREAVSGAVSGTHAAESAEAARREENHQARRQQPQSKRLAPSVA